MTRNTRRTAKTQVDEEGHASSSKSTRSASATAAAPSTALSYYFRKAHPGCPQLDKQPQPETDTVMTEVISRNASPVPSEPKPGEPGFAPRNYEFRKPVVLAANQPLTWFYTQHTEHPAMHPAEQQHLLPSMLQLVTAHQQGKANCRLLFDPGASIHANVCAIFRELKTALFPSACYPHAPSAPADDLPARYLPQPWYHDVWPWAFTLAGSYLPPGAEEGELWDRPCMLSRCRPLPSESASLQRTNGYVQILLGLVRQPARPGRRPWQPVHEYAHRLIYWAMLGRFDQQQTDWAGPNGQQLAGPVVMHTCQERGCLQPHHLVLGNYAENNQLGTRPWKRGMTSQQKRRAKEKHATATPNYGAAKHRRAAKAQQQG